MRAVLVSEFGGPDQLRLSQAADPVAGPGQARIVVHAAGVNPVDAGNRAAAEAHRILERRHASGKIILDVIR